MKRVLVVWGSIVCAAITVGFTLGAIDGTIRDFHVGRTTSGIWVLVTAVEIAIVGALRNTQVERFGSPRAAALAAAH